MAMTLVSTTTVGSGGAASIEFTNIPQTGKDLLLLTSLRNGDAAYVGSIKVQFNNDTSTNYNFRYLRGNGAATPTDRGSSKSQLEPVVVGATATANTFSNGSYYISNYTSTANKSISLDYVTEDNATNAVQEINAASYVTSVGITSVKLTVFAANLVQHSTASLYLVS